MPLLSVTVCSRFRLSKPKLVTVTAPVGEVTVRLVRLPSASYSKWCTLPWASVVAMRRPAAS